MCKAFHVFVIVLESYWLHEPVRLFGGLHITEARRPVLRLAATCTRGLRVFTEQREALLGEFYWALVDEHHEHHADDASSSSDEATVSS